MLRYRYGMLCSATGKAAEAMAALNEVIDHPAEEQKAEAVYGALARRADLKRLDFGDLEGAERDLRRALELCVSANDPTAELSIRKDLAALLLKRGDDVSAIEQFSRALDALFRHRPLQLLPARLLAVDIVDNPQVVGEQVIDDPTRAELKILIDRTDELTRSSVFHRGTRSEHLRLATQRLAELLAGLRPGVIELHSCKVYPSLRKVRASSEDRHIRRSELVLLQCLLGAQRRLSVDELATLINATGVATSKRLSRLRKAIGADLVMRRPENKPRYSIRRPTKVVE
jgi:tetratricopeptide (TPR) repeat protein